ncbi:Tat proofreading chaperone DmsD [Pasteurellaceae bacterium 22721_9_1]
MTNQPSYDWISTSGRLLGALFYYEPSSTQLSPIFQFFQQADWQQDWETEVSGEIIEKIAHGIHSPEIEAEYQALFIGPNNLIAPPWGSVYLDPESVVFGESLIELRQFLQQHQLSFTSDNNEPEDHIGLMLMFAAYLAENQPDLLAEFMQKHLMTWVERYLELMANQQQSLFYQGIAQLTQLTLQGWQQYLGVKTEKVRLYF